ncbi:MAG: hypothetical protein KGI55_11210 [Gammaproteobacteria bacterium]|nr:hypothetical protein [Gammaproteobacteria bacterium]
MNATSAPPTHPLPDLALVRELLGLLFDGFTVKAGAKLDLSPKSGNFCALYVTDTGAPGAVCACDIAFAANGGAALSMLPPNAAKEAVRAKELTEVMIANLREVMNICTRLVLRENTPHLRLDQVYPLASLPAPAAAAIAASTHRIDFELGLGKYGGGIISVLSL